MSFTAVCEDYRLQAQKKRMEEVSCRLIQHQCTYGILDSSKGRVTVTIIQFDFARQFCQRASSTAWAVKIQALFAL